MGGFLLVALLVPLMMTAFAPTAAAEGKVCAGENADESCKDYSLYNLSSNATAYFSNSAAPDEVMDPRWDAVTKNPGRAGSMLGYADPAFSFSLKYLLAEISGSSQTIEYSAFVKTDEKGETVEGDPYVGLRDYAYFGAANRDLGFDSMSATVMGEIIHALAGSLMFIFYALAIAIGWIFTPIIKLLKLLNPFSWFYYGVYAISPTWANGMIGEETKQGDLGVFDGLAHSIGQWYKTLISISGNVLIPLFLAALLLSLVFLKKANTASRVKKFLIRLIFIFVGLPLLGSMYTQVLDRVDWSDSQSAGATKVVLSTYVDFHSWMMNSRLAVPENASIAWDANEGHAQSKSVLAERTSAMAINANSNPAFIKLGPAAGRDVGKDVKTAWEDGSPALSVPCTGDQDPVEDDCDTPEKSGEITATFSLLKRYIFSQDTLPSDFESGVKNAIVNTELTEQEWRKAAWFGYDPGENWGMSYASADEFGVKDDDGLTPVSHPLISTGGIGLTTERDGTGLTTFKTSEGTSARCGFKVAYSSGAPMACNMAPLAAYNYLNTQFDSNSLTTFSSNKAMSGLSRETHAAVSQVGTGPMSFMYWFNSITLLICVVTLGLFYAFGMLFGALKRTFGLVTAVPFATLGAMSSIAKVITYSVALIMEVIGTLFLYNFVSELLISVPTISEGPIGALLNWGPVKGIPALGTVLMIVLTLLSTILTIVVTFAMLKVRSSVLKALDEAVTKVVDKFLETETAPKEGGGMMPALAAGAGAGAGMALGSNMMNRGKGGSGSGSTPGKNGGSGSPSGPPGPTNTGGTNAEKGSPLNGKVSGQLPPGEGGQPGGPGQGIDSGDPGGPGGPQGQGPPSGPKGVGSADHAALMPGPGGKGVGGKGTSGGDGGPKSGDGKASGADLAAGDKGSQMKRSIGSGPKSSDDRKLADQVGRQKGLTGSNQPGPAGQPGKPDSGTATNLGGANRPGSTPAPGTPSSVNAQGGTKQTAGDSTPGTETNLGGTKKVDSASTSQTTTGGKGSAPGSGSGPEDGRQTGRVGGKSTQAPQATQPVGAQKTGQQANSGSTNGSATTNGKAPTRSLSTPDGNKPTSTGGSHQGSQQGTNAPRQGQTPVQNGPAQTNSSNGSAPQRRTSGLSQPSAPTQNGSQQAPAKQLPVHNDPTPAPQRQAPARTPSQSTPPPSGDKGANQAPQTAPERPEPTRDGDRKPFRGRRN